MSLKNLNVSGAAMVEQSTAASHGLAQEAQELSRLMSRFQVGEAAPAPAPRPALKSVSTHAGGGGALRKAMAAPGAEVRADGWEEF